VLNPLPELNNEVKGYFGWHLNDSTRLNSSSGGAFSAIVETFLDSIDGVVFGAVHDLSQKKVYHKKCTISDYYPQRKSKYVFSDLEYCYKEANAELKIGKRVIFSGTPCQISGLKLYLQAEYENLLTIDFICHGVPSMKILNDHINYVSKKRDVNAIDFRSKSFGWETYCLKIDYSNHLHYLKTLNQDAYMFLYMNNYTLRKSCYSCRYSNSKHPADITLADFWGVNSYNSEINDQKGISLLIANTKKGKSHIPEIKRNMLLWDIAFNDYKYVFKEHSSYSKENRRRFFAKYRESNYEQTVQYINRKFILRNSVISFINILTRSNVKRTDLICQGGSGNEL